MRVGILRRDGRMSSDGAPGLRWHSLWRGDGGGYAFAHAGGRWEVEVEHVFELGGDLAEFGDEVEGFGVGDGAADLGEFEGEQEEGGELGGEGLGGGDADLGAGVGGDGALRLGG